MTSSKKLSMLIFSLLLVIASFLFVACGTKDYRNVTLTASQEEISLFASEDNTQNVTFTINNPVSGMDSTLSYNLSNPSICQVSVVSTQNYSTTYAISGIRGGVSDFTVRTNEGNISHTIQIRVREYTSQLTPGDNSLYVSYSREFYPTSADFTFTDTATERALEFYFYGKVNGSTNITADDVTQDNRLVNAFVGVRLVTVEGQDYLIFIDESGLYYTLGQPLQNSNNTFYNFIPVEIEGEEYIFDTTSATSVQAGDKFSFLTINRLNNDEYLSCQRDFYLLLDINSESISHEYGFRIDGLDYEMGSDYLYKIDEIANGEITLIPSYQTSITDGIFIGRTVDFITAYLAVSIDSENDLLQVKASTDDNNVINSKKLGSLRRNGQTIHYYQIDCATGVANSTNFNLNFYYEGFEDSDDSNVNYTYTIPVNIRIIPTRLYVNNIDIASSERVYTFYDSYEGNSGWQEFFFTINPEGAEYDNITIDLRNSDLQLRYNNVTYLNQLVTIDDISVPIYLKGADNASLASDLTLPITLNFNVLQAGSMQVELKYEIVRGATVFEYQTEEFATNIYLDSLNQEPVEFLDLYANAQFSNITVTNLSGQNVARFLFDPSQPYILQGGNYILNISLQPLMQGTGTYSIMLDNGKQQTMTITVNEGLSSLGITTTNEQNSVAYREDISENNRDSSLLYIYNRAGVDTYFDVEVVANGNRNSSAINNIQFNFTSQLLQLGEATNNNKNFNVYTVANGSSVLELEVSGYAINNFTREPVTLNYYLDIVAFDYIGNLNVFKAADGNGEYIDPSSSNTNIQNYGVNAAYADVYSYTSQISRRTASFNVTVNNTDAYLFANPVNLNMPTRFAYSESNFNENFIYWETDSISGITKDGQPVDIMYYDPASQNNIYVIVGFGTFDTSTMTFTALEETPASSRSFKLIAHVRQYGRIYSYTINIRISTYEEVSGIELQEAVSRIEFSALEREHSLIAYARNSTATNGEIVALFRGGSITANGQTYQMLDEDSITYIESERRYQIILTVNEDFVTHAENYQGDMSGTLILAARDWLNDNNTIRSGYENLVREIPVAYANGTELNRFTLDSADDLLNMDLTAHYRVSSTINLSSISGQLPLGELRGSIVGASEYAGLTGLNITTGRSEDNVTYYGLFTKIADGAYIEYISLSGEFNIGASSSETTFAPVNSRIGLLAGENNGDLINIGVTISQSQINMRSGYFGGVVGINNGTILQDYTLFEDGNTRSLTALQLKNEDGSYNIVGAGRYSYAGLNPKVLSYMTGNVSVNYIADQLDGRNHTSTLVGGAVGLNNGSIQKIDSKALQFAGYTNYMAYALLQANPVSFNSTNYTLTNVSYVGGLAGQSGADSAIFSGYNLYQNSTVTFTAYLYYEGDNEQPSNNDYTAGQGIIVGGTISGYDYIGGVVGYIETIGSSGMSLSDFAGITSRTNVRGQLANITTPITARVTAIANIDNVSQLYTAFAIQAVDSGASSINASMIVLHNTSNVGAYYSDVASFIANTNKLAFGISAGNSVDIMYGVKGENPGNKNYCNVYTYAVSRREIIIESGEDADNIINSINNTTYYGDFIIVGNNGNTLLGQSFFTSGGSQLLSLEENYSNRLTSSNTAISNREIYYMFYFRVAQDSETSSQDSQTLLDQYLNYVNFNSVLYPFTTNGEMTFTSNNRDILTIDQNGRINVKGTGLAHISASSILNSNNALEFYIYVVNYFNPDQPSFTESEDDDETSIIYPDTSAGSDAIDNTIINLRGRNTATLYVRPYYSLEIDLISTGDENLTLSSNAAGEASIGGVYFNLATCTQVTAQITKIERLTEDGTYVDATEELSTTVTGQVIDIARNDLTQEADYRLEITPVVSLSVQETGEGPVVYTSSVNKTLDNVVVNYRKGASNINNVRYNEVPLLSSREIDDTIIINSTAVENIPYYYIVDFNHQNIQGSEDLAREFSFKYDLDSALSYGSEFLFNVSFTPHEGNADNLTNQRFDLKITVNKNSQAYKNRYVENIYGQYIIYILAESDRSVYTYITINFDQTNISSVVVDNYTNLNESIGSTGLSSTSEYAYPGTTGLLAITVNPEDSDFDYILIENDQQNSTQGYSNATFGLLSRRLNSSGGDSIFDDSIITGSNIPTGLRLNLNDIINAYNATDEAGDNLYYAYNGVIYIKYDMSSENVVDGSTSNIIITFVKDGGSFQVVKPLTIKLQNYVSVELDGKTPTSTNTGGYYATYNVARGLRYRLNINSYGYDASSISAPTIVNSESSNNSLATIVEENGEYYLEITSSAINYGTNSFDISITATQTEGEVVRLSSSTTRVTVQEYVVNYNDEFDGNSDIITGMGNGIINVQVGTQITLDVNLYDYIEYDDSNVEVVNRVESFMTNLANLGSFTTYTNLITDYQPDYSTADDEGVQYYLGYENGVVIQNANYYFNSNGLNVTPVRTHVPDDRFYYFTYETTFRYNSSSGTYDVLSADSLIGQKISTEFVFNVYSSSSEESPLPIYDYNDFLDMQAGGYYILLNDITLPNRADEANGIEAYTPRSATFKSLDGNGHTVNFAGTYDMGSLTNIGLFTSLPEGSIIRNLNINFTSATDGSDTNLTENDDYGWFGLRTVKFVTTASSFNFGSIVVDNQGIITNCHVTTDTVNGSEYYVVVQADNALSGSSYMGGLVALNSGYITNCSVFVNMKTPYNMAGVVAQNSNKVASTYFKGGKLINNSQLDQHIAGFAISNTQSGQIITSYVAGEASNTSIYSKDTESYIMSTIAAAGFAYQNAGTISDCYTDILLSRTTADMAGFAYYNGGNIKNSFSLSVLRNNVTASSGFARYNTYENSTGSFENCYYFYNMGAGQTEDGFLPGEGNINTSVVPINYDGIQRLNAGDFANLDEYFSNYSYQTNMSTNGVWFYSTGNTSQTFVDYIPTTEKVEISNDEAAASGNVQTNTVYRTEIKIFGLNRLELVAPNVASLSIQNFSYSEIDDSTGEIVYHYEDDPSVPNRGSLHNPRLIYDAESMESLTEQSTSTHFNTTNYRLVSDIDYSEYDGLSSLYQTVYAGVFEGNGMEISQISLVAMDSMSSAGLFAQIGYSASSRGSVKNLTITPSQIAFTNTNSVGTLAGVLRYGYVYDITVNGRASAASTDARVVIGRNFVGGVIGRAYNNYSMKNITSNINVSSTYTSTSDNIYSEGISSLTRFSYAGGIAGFLGTGEGSNFEINNTSSIQGSRAGFAVGGIGQGANIDSVFVEVMQGAIIRAYHYGGFVAGEVAGNLSRVQVIDNNSDISTFVVIPRAANAVGGITGALAGGTISDAVMEQSFTATAISNTSTVVNSVGGIAGVVTNAGNRVSYIKDSVVSANTVTGSSVLGGAVGQVENALNIDGVAVKSQTLTVVGQKANPYLGGVVGNITSLNNASLTMSNSYCWSNLVINTNTSGVESSASAGGLVGYASRAPHLSYCYTTSTVEATVVDLRSIDSVSNYSSLAEEDRTYAIYTYSTTSENCNNVYYLGHNTTSGIDGSDALTAYNASTPYGISFNTKVQYARIGLRINNYGTSSASYSGQFAAAGVGGVGQDPSSFNNLFGSTYQIPYYNSASGTFEDVFFSNNTYILNSDNHFEFDEGSGLYIQDITITEENGPLTTGLSSYNNSIDITYINGGVTYIYGTYDGVTAFWVQKPDGNYEDTDTHLEVLPVRTVIHKEFRVNTLVHMTEYTDGNENYYQHCYYNNNGTYVEAYENLTTGAIYIKVGDNWTNTVNALDIITAPTIQVWNISTEALSTLAFENDLDWIR